MVKDEENSSNDFTFYKFETATICPIDRNLVEKSLLDENEIEYFNAYHIRVHDTLAPFLDGVELSWLKKVTTPI